MALNKSQLVTQLKAAFDAAKDEEENQDEVLQQLCSDIADAIDTYVKTASVSTNVTGTCQTPSGPGTITGTGSGTLN